MNRPAWCTKAQYAVYRWLADHRDAAGLVAVSSRTLAASLDLSRATVQPALDRLCVLGWIEQTEPGTPTRPAGYRVLVEVAERPRRGGPISRPPSRGKPAEGGPISRQNSQEVAQFLAAFPQPSLYKDAGARPRAKIHSLSNNPLVSEGSGKVGVGDHPERPKPERPDERAEEVVCYVAAWFGCQLDPWMADEFRQMPRRFGLPPAALCDWVLEKCREKQKRRYRLTGPGALWRFAPKDVPTWWANHRREFEQRRAVLFGSEEEGTIPRRPPGMESSFAERAYAAAGGY